MAFVLPPKKPTGDWLAAGAQGSQVDDIVCDQGTARSTREIEIKTRTTISVD